MNWKGCGSKRLRPNQGTIPEFILRGRVKARNTLIRIAGAPTKIRMKYLPNTSPKRYRLSQLDLHVVAAPAATVVVAVAVAVVVVVVGGGGNWLCCWWWWWWWW
jgi:hypothetical protein